MVMEAWHEVEPNEKTIKFICNSNYYNVNLACQFVVIKNSKMEFNRMEQND